MGRKNLHASLEAFVDLLPLEYDNIPASRRQQLDELASYIRRKGNRNEEIKLTFICTHNSRRSHMAQLWAQAAAFYYGIQGLATFSGGTKATAFFPSAVKAMEKAGFEFCVVDTGENPHYEVSFSAAAPAQRAFSKKYGDEPNPASGFAAIMTCSDADRDCPYVRGADARFAIPYEDPKKYDGTGYETAAYDERCLQIGREMFYAFSSIS